MPVECFSNCRVLEHLQVVTVPEGCYSTCSALQLMYGVKVNLGFTSPVGCYGQSTSLQLHFGERFLRKITIAITLLIYGYHCLKNNHPKCNSHASIPGVD